MKLENLIKAKAKEKPTTISRQRSKRFTEFCEP